MDDLDRLERLEGLRARGAITEAEFQQQKTSILTGKGREAPTMLKWVWLAVGLVLGLFALGIAVSSSRTASEAPVRDDTMSNVENPESDQKALTDESALQRSRPADRSAISSQVEQASKTESASETPTKRWLVGSWVGKEGQCEVGDETRTYDPDGKWNTNYESGTWSLEGNMLYITTLQVRDADTFEMIAQSTPTRWNEKILSFSTRSYRSQGLDGSTLQYKRC